MRSDKNKQQPWGWKLLPPYLWATLHSARPSSSSPFRGRILGLVATFLVVFWVLKIPINLSAISNMLFRRLMMMNWAFLVCS